MASPSNFGPAPGFQPPRASFAAQSPDAWRQSVLDDEHLRLLRVGYFISAGYTAIFIPLGLLYVVFGVMMWKLPSSGSSAPPDVGPWVFGIMGGLFAMMASLGVLLKVATAIKLKQRRSRSLCLITAGLSSLEIPYGTALGIMTFVVLGRPSVQQLFESEGQQTEG